MLSVRQQNRTASFLKYRVVYLLIACVLLFALTNLLQATEPLKPSVYNTYTIQAMQWRQGKIALDHDYPHLELAIYQGNYYVSFPPVPTIPIYVLTFIFGEKVPDALLVQIYAALACLLAYGALKDRIKYPAITAFLLCFGCCLLPILQNGAVWYQAEVLAFLLTIAAIERMGKGKITISLFLYALSVGCRPFNALYGPLLLYWGFKQGGLRRLVPGVIWGLCAAAAYGAYNYVRFLNVLEFGHNYLPEFSTQGGVQFALDHIGKNAATFIYGLPFYQTRGGLEVAKFGFSLFLANPVLLCFCLWFIWDIIKKRMTLYKAAIFSAFVLHTLLLLAHRTCGGFQFGARYFVDCVPYALLYMNEQEPFKLSYGLLAMGLIFNLYGAWAVHI